MGSERVVLGIPKRQKERKGALAFSKVLICPQGRVPSVSNAGSLHNSVIHLKSAAVNTDKCNLLQGRFKNF